MRLKHVLDKLGYPNSLKDIPYVIKAMVNDIQIESEGEVVWSKAAEKAIGTKTVMVYKKHISLLK